MRTDARKRGPGAATRRATPVDFGALETFLANLRAKKANSLISDSLRAGRILDLGCGWNQRFLSLSNFAMKVGLDRPEMASTRPGSHSVQSNLEGLPFLPFRDGAFSAVTMLAVLEHICPEQVDLVLQESHRVLCPGGVLVVTTPLAWTDVLLRAMARLRLLSRFHIDDHERTYNFAELRALFRSTGFDPQDLQFGRFELGANAWLVARK